MNSDSVGNNNYNGYRIKRQEPAVQSQIKDLRKYTKKVAKTDSVVKPLTNKQIAPLPKREISPISSTNTDPPNPSSTSSNSKTNPLKIRSLEDQTKAVTQAAAKQTSSPEPEKDLSFVYAPSEATSELSDTPAQKNIKHPYLESFILIAAIVAHENNFNLTHLTFNPHLDELATIADQNSDYQLLFLGNPVETLIADYEKEISKNLAQIHRLDEENKIIMNTIVEQIERIDNLLDVYEEVKGAIETFKEVPAGQLKFKQRIIKELTLSTLSPPVLKDTPTPQPLILKPLRDTEITEKEKLDVEANFQKNFGLLDQKEIQELVKNVVNGSVTITSNETDMILNLVKRMGGLPIVERLRSNLDIKKNEAAQVSVSKRTAQESKGNLRDYSENLKSYLKNLNQKMDGARKLMQEASRYVTFPNNREELLALIQKLHSI